MPGVRHTFSVNIADDASAVAAGEVLPSQWNAEHTLSDVAAQTSLDAVSNAVSVISQQVSVLSQQVSTLSQAVSVISNQVSVLSVRTYSSQLTGAVSVSGLISSDNRISNAVSNEISNRTSADNVLSAAISVISQQVSVLSQNVSVLSQGLSALSNAVSVADAALSNRVGSVNVFLSGISARSVGGISTHGIQSVVDALSNRISGVAGGGSATPTSNQFSIISQQVSVLSQQMSVISQQVSVLSNAISVVSNAVSIVSTAASNALSVANAASNAASIVSTAASNALSVANAASNAASIVSANLATLSLAVSVISQAVSVLSNKVSALSAVSARNTAALSVQGLQSIVNALSNRISAAGGGAGSVTSTEVSAVSQQASVALEAKAPWLGAQLRTRAAVITVSAATLTNIPSLSVSVAAGGMYLIDAMVAWDAATSGGFAFGISVPPLAVLGGGFKATGTSAAINPNRSAIALSIGVTVLTQLVSVSATVVSQQQFFACDGFVNVSAAGTVQLMARTSVAGSGMRIRSGYIRAYRLL